MALKKFLFDYKNSVFRECNAKLYKENMNLTNHKVNTILNESVRPGLSYIADSLERMFVRYFLAQGTLLGWYRDCGIIPFTTDGDIGVPIEYYTDDIKQHFLGNPNVELWAIQGLQNDSMELRLADRRYAFQFDIFLIYSLNQSYSYIPIQAVSTKIR